jgi:plasmid segregation protein ParM
MFVVAVDVGYSNLKIISGQLGSAPTTRIVPAGAGPVSAMPEQLGRAREDQHVDVLVNGERWVAGVEPSRLQNWERELHPDYPETLAYLALYHAALALAGAEQVDLLVTGLPVSQYQDAARREALRKLLVGAHQVTEDRQVHVKAVDVLAQPAGAYLDMVERKKGDELLKHGRTLVIDPGFFSFDWVLIDDGELRSANSNSSPSAMSLLIEGVDDLIQQDHGTRLGRDEIEKLVRTGAQRVQLFGAPVELARYIASAAERTAKVALTAAKQSLRSERRPVDVVLLAGGGAKVYYDAAIKAFPKARVEESDEPALANARGYWAHAEIARSGNQPESHPAHQENRFEFGADGATA